MDSIEINLDNLDEDLGKLEEKLPKEFRPKNSFTYKQLKKIDVIVFKLCEKVILYFVRHYKYEKNKYKIQLLFQQFLFFLFFLTFFILCPIGNIIRMRSLGTFSAWDVSLTLSLTLLIFIPILFFEFMEWLSTKRKAIDYDILFLMRKHPNVYHNVKAEAKIKFVMFRVLRIKMLKFRLMSMGFFYPLMILLFAVTGFDLGDSFIFYFMFSHSLLILNDYIEYIFDFDEPDKKKKPAKKEVSAIVQKILDNLIGRAMPLPRPI